MSSPSRSSICIPSICLKQMAVHNHSGRTDAIISNRTRSIVGGPVSYQQKPMPWAQSSPAMSNRTLAMLRPSRTDSQCQTQVVNPSAQFVYANSTAGHLAPRHCKQQQPTAAHTTADGIYGHQKSLHSCIHVSGRPVLAIASPESVEGHCLSQ
jgi:hypothetical protein